MGMPDADGGSRQQARRPGRVIPFGKYLLLERVALGGMAEVYMAKSFGIEGFEKLLAIKRILPTMAEDEDFINMFVDEAKIAGQLNHANIAPIYELGKIGDSHYIAMEYVWGKDLLQIMNRFRRMRKKMPPAMVAWIGAKMCEALDYAHNKKDRRGTPLNIIHRDISPQNCLVSYEGEVKVIDFGIAKAASRTTKTQAGVLKGKFGYMSPEQVRGLPIDARSDLFAVGTCMYEMLTSDRLFVGESDLSTLERVRNAEVPPITEVVPDCPAELGAIVMRTLSREPDDRYQNGADMQEALMEFLATQRPPFGTSKLAAWMRTAFATEMTREKARLDALAQVGRPSALGAAPRKSGSAPPPPPPPPTDAVPSGTEELDTGDLETLGAEGAEPGPTSEFAPDEEFTEQPTQIFFSAEEEAAQAPPAVSSPPPAAQPAGGFEVAPPVASSVNAPTLVEPGKKKRKSMMGTVAIAAAALVGLGIVGAMLFGGTPTGTIEVRVVPAVEATIALDGQLRGTAPLRLEEVPQGDHTVLVIANGYPQTERRVTVAEATAAIVEVELKPSTAAAPPVAVAVADPPAVPTQPTAAPQAPEPPAAAPSAPEPPAAAPTPSSPSTSGTGATPPERTPRTTPSSMDEAPRRPSRGGGGSARATKTAAGGSGTLVINSLPWARVFIDGRDTRQNTPIRSLRVRAGTHQVGFKTADGQMHTFQVEVPDGETVRVSKSF